MAREENSLLFSLKEVANTLQDRLKEEEDSRAAAVEAERRAKEDAIRRVKEEEEAKIRAAEDAIRREREEKERKEREDRIRLEEAERRARIEAEARIEEANLRAATEAIKSKPLPVKLIAAVSAVFIMISIVIVVGVKRAQDAAKKQAIADAISRIESERKKDRDESARLQKALTDRLNEARSLEDQVNAAKSEKERLELAEKAKAAASAASRAASEAAAQRAASKERDRKAKLERCKNADDPLCGI